ATFTDTGLPASTSYSYRVRASDTANNLSAYSNTATPTTQSSGIPTPTPPTNLTAIAGAPGPVVVATQGYINGTSLTSHTTAAFDSTGGDLMVMCASSHLGVTMTPTDSFGNAWISAAGPTNTTTGDDLRTQVWYARLPTVGPGHTLTISLSVADSLVISVIVVKGSNTTTPIAAISAIGNDGGTQSLSVASPNIATTTFSDTNVTPSTSYSYRVRASDTANNVSAYSNTASVAMPTGPAPAAPANLTAITASSSQINLSWAAATEPGGTISSYLVERCQGASCTGFVQIGTSTTTALSDTGLNGSTTYCYRVRAQDAANNIG